MIIKQKIYKIKQTISYFSNKYKEFKGQEMNIMTHNDNDDNYLQNK